MTKKEVTIEDLAVKVENGFQKSDKRFEDLAKIVNQNSVDIKESSIRMEKGFAASDQKFEDLARMTQNGFLEMSKNMADGFANFKVYVDKRFDIVDKRFEGVDKRFDAMDKRFDSIDQQLISIRVEIKQIWEKIAEIEKKLDDVHIRTLEDDNAISTEIIKLENEIKFIKDDIKRIKMRQNIKA